MKDTQKVVILGGGQLAKMLAEQGIRKHGFDVTVLAKSPEECALTSATSFRLVDFDDAGALNEAILAHGNAVFTTESEFYSGRMLSQIFHRDAPGRMYPHARNIIKLQHRYKQKLLLQEHGLPVTPFVYIRSVQELEKAKALLGYSFVLKQCMHGYDGKGTTIVKSQADYEAAKKLDFENPRFEGFIAEPFIDFSRELAFQVVRSTTGEIKYFPLVETHQTDHQLDWLVGPMSHDELEGLQVLVNDFLKAINYAGVIAFEFFEHQGKLLINETAPRVHNSGHHTLESCLTDQFTEHWHGILGWKLVEPAVRSPFAMVNIIGKSNLPLKVQRLRGTPHVYGKKENRPGRKMGHVTLLGQNPWECLQILREQRDKYVL